MYKLYTKPSCQACRIVERELIKKGREYETLELTDETIQTYTEATGTRPTQAPILELHGHMAAGLLPSLELARHADATSRT